MKKYMVLCAGLAVAFAFTSCKSSESAYRKAYEKAKAQETNTTVVTPGTETTVVAPVVTRPPTETVVVDNVDNAVVRPENVQLINGSGLRNFSVVVGSFGVRANAEGLQQAVVPRILSIDYGKRRTGLAVTDPLQIIAGGLATVSTSELYDYLVAYVSREPVERIVIGKPIQPNGQPSENLARVEQFVNRWRKAQPQLPIEYVDERFTSVLAHRAMIDGGLKKKARQDKARTRHLSTRFLPPSSFRAIWKAAGDRKSSGVQRSHRR